MSRNYNQDHFKVGGTPMRSRALARLARRQLTTLSASLRQQAGGRRFASSAAERSSEQASADEVSEEVLATKPEAAEAARVGEGSFRDDQQEETARRKLERPHEGGVLPDELFTGPAFPVSDVAELSEEDSQEESRSLAERLAGRLPGTLGEKVRSTWKKRRWPLGVAAALALAPLVVSRYFQRFRDRRAH